MKQVGVHRLILVSAMMNHGSTEHRESSGFRSAGGAAELARGAALIGTIDRGERWIYEGANGSGELGSVLERLVLVHGDTFGTFHACVFRERLRAQIGFDPDLPAGAEREMVRLIEDARDRVPGPASIWYTAGAPRLHALLSAGLPWEARGGRTCELTARDDDTLDQDAGGSDQDIVPCRPGHVTALCEVFDRALAHTFDDPNEPVFTPRRDEYAVDWAERAARGECAVLVRDGSVVGGYVLKGAEIELMAVGPQHQGQGLGRRLLRHAISSIVARSSDPPHLYCIARNLRALSFYLREGLVVTGDAGYLMLPA